MSIKADIDLVELVQRIKTNRAYASILKYMDSIRVLQPHGDSTWLVPLEESADLFHEAAKHPRGQVAKNYSMSLGEVVELLYRLGLIPDEPTNEAERAKAVAEVQGVMEKHKNTIPIVTFDPAAVIETGTDTGNTDGEGI
jgi:hypothetical protein